MSEEHLKQSPVATTPSGEERILSDDERIEEATKKIAAALDLSVEHLRLKKVPDRMSGYLAVPLKDAEGNVLGIINISSASNAEDEVMTLTIPREQFEALTVKTREVLAESALAKERIAKDQEEIDLLRTETRETLRQLRAA